MFSHVMLGVNDMDASIRFYNATLGALGHSAGVMDSKGRCVYRTDTGVLLLSAPINGEAANGANGGTIGFLAEDSAAADAWHSAGVANGGTACEEPPGPRGDPATMYLAYLRDPAGNKLCTLQRLG